MLRSASCTRNLICLLTLFRKVVANDGNCHCSSVCIALVGFGLLLSLVVFRVLIVVLIRVIRKFVSVISSFELITAVPLRLLPWNLLYTCERCLHCVAIAILCRERKVVLLLCGLLLEDLHAVGELPRVEVVRKG